MSEGKHNSIQKQLSSPGNSLYKYRNALVGDRSFLKLIAYEIIIFTTASLPRQTGIKLRSFFYSALLKRIGRSVKIGRDCSMMRPHLIEIGDHVILDDKVALDVKLDGKGITLMDGVVIGDSTVFSCPGGQITVGMETTIGSRCRLGSLQGLSVGKGCTIGDNTYIVGAGHRFDDIDRPIIVQGLTCKGPSVIGDNVIIGDRVTVLDGVTIGSDSHIATGSLVNKNVPPNSYVSGVPARVS